jgi:hypothetical protein
MNNIFSWKVKGKKNNDTYVKVFKLLWTIEAHIDANGFAIGSVLMQDGHPITFESKKLTRAQLKWAIHEKFIHSN